MVNLKIDPEFRDVLPAKEEDYLKLEKTVLEDGRFTDPFITWNGFILDGHTRYRIMQNHPEIDLQPYEKKMDDVLSDRYAAIVWIATHQESRRNLNDFEWADIHKKAYDAEKKSQGGNHGNQYTKVAKFDSELCQREENSRSHAGETATVLAAKFGMKSASQFKHSVRTANAMEEADRLVPGALEAIKSGNTGVSKNVVESILNIKGEEDRKEFVQSIVDGEKPKAAVKMKKEGDDTIAANISDEKRAAIQEELNSSDKSHKQIAREQAVDRRTVDRIADKMKDEFIDGAELSARALSKRIDEDYQKMVNQEKHEYTIEDAEDEFGIIMDEFISKLRRVIQVRKEVIKGNKMLKQLIIQFSIELKRLKEEI